MSTKARRGIIIEVDGSLEDLDRHAEDLLTLGVYEVTLERTLELNEPLSENALRKYRTVAQDGLTIR